MKEVFRTSVLKEFPFPIVSQERFCPEILVWNRIATKYKLRYMNRVVYWVEYQTDGLSANIIRIRMNSPIATCMTYSEMLRLDIPFVQKVKAAINYYRFRSCIKAPFKNSNVPHISFRYFWTIPIGYLMHLRDTKIIEKL